MEQITKEKGWQEDISSLTKKVARSIYLTFKILPQSIYQPIVVAFLLAKSCDTIVDTATIPLDERKKALLSLSSSLNNEADISHIQNIIDLILPYQNNENERQLISHLTSQLAWFAALSATDQVEVRKILNNIITGMLFELNTFNSMHEVRSFDLTDQVEEYIYHITSSVGVFWTDICLNHIPSYSSLDKDELFTLALSYAHGLQIINICQGIVEDYHVRKKCFIPADQLQTVGLTPETLLTDIEKLAPILTVWRKTAWDNLDDGIKYTTSLNHYRSRLACALPVIIGMQTLFKLKDIHYLNTGAMAKVKRMDVYKMLLYSIVCASSKSLLKRFFNHMRKKFHDEDNH